MRRFFILLTIIITFFIAYIWVNGAFLLGEIIENKMGVPVSIGKLEFHADRITIRDFNMDNALTVETIDIQTPYYSYFLSPIVIKNVRLDNVGINIEFTNKQRTEGNWVSIMKSMNKNTTSLFSIERVTIIDTLLIRNIAVELDLPGQRPNRPAPIKQLTFTNIRSEKGVPTQEIADLITNYLVNEVFTIHGIDIILAVPKAVFSPFKLFMPK